MFFTSAFLMGRSVEAAQAASTVHHFDGNDAPIATTSNDEPIVDSHPSFRDVEKTTVISSGESSEEMSLTSKNEKALKLLEEFGKFFKQLALMG